MSSQYSGVGIVSIDGMDIGNALSMSLLITTAIKSMTPSSGGVVKGLSRIEKVEVRVTCGELIPEVLAIALSGVVISGAIGIGCETQALRHFVFVGENTLTGTAITLDLPYVRFESVRSLDLLSEDITTIELSGMVYKDENNPAAPFGLLTIG